jgi:hypothetical protein
VVGTAAVGLTDDGAPSLKGGGVYESTLRTLTNGIKSFFRFGNFGEMQVNI